MGALQPPGADGGADGVLRCLEHPVKIARRYPDSCSDHGGIELRVANAAIDISERAPPNGGLCKRWSLRHVSRAGFEGDRQNVQDLRRQASGAPLARLARDRKST